MVALMALAGLVCGDRIRALAASYRAGDGEPLAPARPWPALELVTAAVVALAAWRAGPPYACFAVIAVALAVIDWRTSTLPDAITLPAYPIMALALLPTGALPRALAGGAALTAVYGLLWLLRPEAMGLGDVKIAGLIGMAGAALSWQALVAAAFCGQLLGALYALSLLVTGRGTRHTQFPFGTFMLLGTLPTLCLAS
ncbi:leader peptidase (prepilin peptidase)/N-methyltransferase [Nonomuraea thailandensis]|uniref:Leader peptidase (Prepilin peptidase)/N-methyltransferase n=1 Tax=Nonomuraea thailandensis TaxID=1188745 RepID=A0A9X2G8W1_9ACTN|nr:A24 family peptidase [Nonomuraea thailandensis]MCP2354441.1 leader peptidase (prepilin peptidase)/N-methyltransferase [Nonomuraea thailandensis]